ncbi:MAG: hypothetical protein O2798_04195 [Chloroflexi bacterium]|nr:hypothetical protein [Chloroflexota bacterium]MDA1240025.1 hypothetical protein [Chloroflexota bacterium]
MSEITRAFRCPFPPAALRRLGNVEGYLEVVWPRVKSSVETAGFLGSALYMADMALDAVESVYEPVMTRDTLRAAGLTEDDLAALDGVVDLFHYTQPQVLLFVAALAEAFRRDSAGGYGKAEPRPVTEREQRHLGLAVTLAPADAGLLPEITEALGLAEPPDLYRAAAAWPAYLGGAWEELQHLVTFPDFRRRGRGLYYYARSGARFLAEPLEANPAALAAAGLSDTAIADAGAALDEVLSAQAMMVMHAEAIRLGLGVRDREVVRPA